jgi:hypothetical protein
MNLPAVLRPPLLWLVAAEVALVASLGAVAWHVWQEHAGPGPAAAAPVVVNPAPARQPTRPAPGAGPRPTSTPAVGPTPGIRTDADFLARQLDELNRVEAAFEDLEWKVTSAIVSAIQHYVEGVVLPAISRAESGHS